MAIVIASALGKRMGGEPLFDDVSFKLEAGDRMTLSGRNGAGKTTLLRLLSGELPADSGEISLRKGAKVVLHDQRPPRETGVSLREYALSARTEMLALERELSRLEEVMAAGDHTEATMRSYSAAQHRLEAAGGYRWRDDVRHVLHGLGFTDQDLDRPLHSFSGGETTRAALARVLSAGADLLLLDEPTNHLDIPSLEWLERHLSGLDAAVVLVAHDRWFLEEVGTSVLELEAGRARFFAGPWHAWRKEQAARELALGRAIERQQAEIARMEKFVERFRYKATKARQAQSKLKAIERVKRGAATRDPRDSRSLTFSFDRPERSGRVTLELENARLEVPGRTLLDGAEMWIERGEHVVLVGRNGTGKTTLIEALSGRTELAAGAIRTGHNVKVGYLSQHADSAAGDGTVLEAAQRGTGLTGQRARDLLGGFLFSGEDVEKKLSDISGGEQRRLSLAILVASGANLLILDEPTNHLDVESREALEDALAAFEGSVLLISHDRALLEAVGSRTIAFEERKLRSFPGPWAEYRRAREEEEELERAAGEAAHAAGSRSAPAASESTNGGAAKPLSKNAQKRLRELERAIERAEAELSSLEDELTDPAAWSSPGRSKRSTERHERAKQAVAELYEEYESAGG